MTGLDSSPEMIETARRDVPGLEFEVADLRDWARRLEHAPDVLVSNATLQWVPGHLDLLPSLVAQVAPGGWFAFQVPGNFGEPSHTIRTELAGEAPYVMYTAGVAVPSSHDPADYYDVLADAGCTVDAWETTYLHVLSGPDPVFTWVSGTGARPTLQALPPDLRASFEAEFKARLSAAYPTRADGTVLMPFRRIFVVGAAHRVRLHHVQVACPPGGEDAARRFYAEGLGLTEVAKPDELAGRGGVWFRSYDDAGAVVAELHVGVEEPFAPARKAHPAFVLADVAELEATAARLTALGYDVDVRERHTFPGHQRFHVYDGAGNRVEVLSP